MTRNLKLSSQPLCKTYFKESPTCEDFVYIVYLECFMFRGIFVSHNVLSLTIIRLNKRTRALHYIYLFNCIKNWWIKNVFNTTLSNKSDG